MTEDQLQAAEVKWFDEQYPQHRKMLFAVPNGGLREKRTAALIQATGAKKGVADLVLVVYELCVFIENKVGNNTTSEDQDRFRDAVKLRGHPYHVVYTLEEFKEVIKLYI